MIASEQRSNCTSAIYYGAITQCERGIIAEIHCDFNDAISGTSHEL